MSTIPAGPACDSYVEMTAGGLGAFGDDGRHAPTLRCLQATVERANERLGIWRPLLKKMNRIRSVLYGTCFVDPGNETPKPRPAEIVFIQAKMLPAKNNLNHFCDL